MVDRTNDRHCCCWLVGLDRRYHRPESQIAPIQHPTHWWEEAAVVLRQELGNVAEKAARLHHSHFDTDR